MTSWNSPAKLDAGFLKGRRVCVTGSLASMTHAEFRELVTALGGRCAARPGRFATLLVMGDVSYNSQAACARRARRFGACGYPVEWVSETEFFQSLGLIDRDALLGSLLTLDELAEIVDAPALLIRQLVRDGIVEPALTVHHFHYFDYPQAASVRHVLAMFRRGATPAMLIGALKQARAQLGHLAFRRIEAADFRFQCCFVVRIGDWLYEPNGQRVFEFSEEEFEQEMVRLPREDKSRPNLSDAQHVAQAGGRGDLFDSAFALEQKGRLKEADSLYRQAAAQMPHDAAIWFNWGNVLYGLEEDEQAAERFHRAVQLDSTYVQAWNNYGVALLKLGAWRQAIGAFRRAVSLAPQYAQARENLDEALDRLMSIEWRAARLKPRTRRRRRSDKSAE